MLSVTVIETCDCPHRKRLITKTNQYLVVSVGSTRRVTTCKKSSGRSAKFDERFVFNYTGEPTATFELFDWGRFTSDEFLGSGRLSLKMKNTSQWRGPVKLTNCYGKPRGSVVVSVSLDSQDRMLPSALPGRLNPNAKVHELDSDSLSESDMFADLPAVTDLKWKYDMTKPSQKNVESQLTAETRNAQDSLTSAGGLGCDDVSAMLDSSLLRDVAALTGSTPLGHALGLPVVGLSAAGSVLGAYYNGGGRPPLIRMPSDNSWAAGV